MVGRGTYDGLGDYPANVQQWGQSTQTLTPAVSPLDHWNEQAGSMGLSLSFVIDYIAANPGVDVVLVPLAEGGTSFTAGDWPVPTGPLYNFAVTALNDLFAENPEFQLKGFLWHQGEGDVASGAPTYAANLDALIAALRANVNAATDTTPFICGGMTNGTIDRSNINAILADTPNRVPYTGFAVGNNLTLFDGTHFDAASLRTLGSRYYAQLAAAQVNVPKPPQQVTGLTAVAGDAQVTLNWTAPYSQQPITDYLIEVNVDGGGWGTVADGVGSGTSFVHTGLTNDMPHVYRVSAISVNGTGAASATASATPVGVPAPVDVEVVAFSRGESGTIATAGHTFTGLAAAPGMLVVGVASRGTQSVDCAHLRVTANGTPMTLLRSEIGGTLSDTRPEPGHVISMWGIENFTGASVDIVLTTANAVQRAGCVVWSVANATLVGASMQSRSAIATDTAVAGLTRNINVPAGGILLAYGNALNTESSFFSAGIDQRFTRVEVSSLFWHFAGDRLYPAGATAQPVTMTIGPTIPKRLFVAGAFAKKP
jgi:hypothetical protein